MRLRRSDVNGPGYRRRRAGRGFAYYDERRRADQGRPGRPDPGAGHPAGLAGRLDLPLAQRAHPGHRGRRRRPAAVPLPRPVAGPPRRGEARAGAGDRPAAARRPRRRRRRDLRTRGLTRERVLATAVRLLDLGAFRIGSEQYAEENGTYGLATLRRDHVRVRGERTFFSYTAKGGIEREVEITDRPTATVVRQLLRAARRRRRGPARLLGRDPTDGDLARRHQQRDQRLPQGDQRRGDHRQGLPHLERDRADGRDPRRGAAADEPGPRGRRRSGRRTCGSSEQLGNTPAVCKASYVDPRVVDRFEHGETVADALRAGGRGRAATGTAQRVLEEAVCRCCRR